MLRTISSQRTESIVEIGIHSLALTNRMLDLANQRADAGEIRYTGIDQFEGRDEPDDSISLKTVHTALSAQGAKIRLVPGDAFSALARTANSLIGTDLIIIHVALDSDSMGRAWMYLPRMMHDETIIYFRQGAGQTATYSQIDRPEIGRLSGVRRAA